ncbi:MAG: aminotransferase class V-fold PLP-dependent enzyme, partial [Bacilli bacterium]|nr:aminotransferase class V-fold PLP-dependent enzyme [Bacilli bacterium]
NNIGLLNIIEYMDKLKDYAYSKLKEVDNIIIYNKPDTPIFAINIKDIFAQDLSIYLDKYNICTRAGNHCAKVLKEEINVKNTVRISLHFYNTFEEVDYLVKVLNNKNIKNEII